MITYTVEELISLRGHYVLKDRLRIELLLLNGFKKQENKRRIRGSRGGKKRNAPRSIPVHISVSRVKAVHKRPVQHRSNIPVSIERHIHAREETVKIATFNVRSLKNKINDVHTIFTELGLAVLALTETWHEGLPDYPVRALRNLNYNVVEEARSVTDDNSLKDYNWHNYGGVMLISRSDIKITKVKADKFSQFEYLITKIKIKQKHIILACIYRPGSRAVTNEFYEQFKLLLEKMSMHSCEIIITGDINIRLDREDDTHAKKLLEMLNDFGLCQNVFEPTHCRGGLLDVIITKQENKLVTHVHDAGLSDHKLVYADVGMTTRTPEYIESCRRLWKNFNYDSFESDLKSSRLCEDLSGHFDNPDELVEIYNTTLTGLLDARHAPFQSVKRLRRTSDPWFDDGCRTKKRQMRRHERIYRKNGGHDQRVSWLNAQREYKREIDEKKSAYWKGKILSEKSLWKTLKTVSEYKNNSPKSEKTSEQLADYFDYKVSTIQNGLTAEPWVCGQQRFTSHSLEHFELATPDEVIDIIMKSENKQSMLDPMPMWLLKKCLGVLIDFIVLFLNASLSKGHIPLHLKCAQVTPILKKQDGDPDDEKNYRPISNLPYLAKLLEKIVSRRITAHINENSLWPKYQSAYRRHHSTETSVVRLLSDIVGECEKGKLVLLCLLDMSAAFDTVDHDILMQRLDLCFGVRGEALKWIGSYLSDRHQTVCFNGSKAEPRLLKTGVPQGSVLGPLLFILYVSEIEKIVTECGFRVCSYADDIQIYASVEPDQHHVLQHELLRCIDGILRWTCLNRLCLNPEKTEFMWMASKGRGHLIPQNTFRINDKDIEPVTSARVLGIHLESDLSMSKQISGTVKSGFFFLRQLKAVKRNISTDSLKTLVNSFVVSRLDYCSTVYANMPNVHISRLQSVLNASARLITNQSKYCHITPLLRGLHWLPKWARIDFRVCVLVYRAMNNISPSYLKEMFSPKIITERRTTLRSAQSLVSELEQVRRRNPTRYGDRALCVVGPKLWNALPLSIRQAETVDKFKGLLKTHFFRIAY
jgi:exonuclease III